MTRALLVRWLGLVRCLVVVGALAALAGPAGAGTFGLVAGGDEAKQPVVETELGPWLTDAGKGDVKVGAAALDAKQITQIVNCFILADQACAQQAVATGNHDGLLFVMVEVERDPAASGDRIKVTGWLYGPGGAPIAAQSLFCNDCKNDTLKPKLAELARLLFSAASSGAGRLEIDSTPDGARVLVDGEPVGKTPMSVGVREGSHTVTLELPGHRTVTRKVDIQNDAVAKVEADLERLDVGGGKGGNSLRPVGYGMLAVGGAAIVGGAVLMFVVDEDPVTTPTTDPTYTEATLPGAVALGAGVAVAAIGGYLAFRGGGEPRRAEPVARMTGGGAVFGVAGRF
jgi:hypothetical protein